MRRVLGAIHSSNFSWDSIVVSKQHADYDFIKERPNILRLVITADICESGLTGRQSALQAARRCLIMLQRRAFPSHPPSQNHGTFQVWPPRVARSICWFRYQVYGREPRSSVLFFESSLPHSCSILSRKTCRWSKILPRPVSRPISNPNRDVLTPKSWRLFVRSRRTCLTITKPCRVLSD